MLPTVLALPACHACWSCCHTHVHRVVWMLAAITCRRVCTTRKNICARSSSSPYPHVQCIFGPPVWRHRREKKLPALRYRRFVL